MIYCRNYFPLASRAVLAVAALSMAIPLSAIAALPGAFDPTFGSGGVVQIDYENLNDSGVALAADKRGQILVGGLTDISIVTSGVARLRADGSLDTNFGHVFTPGRAPIVSQPSANGVLEQATAVGRRSDGMPIHAGYYYRDGQYRAFVSSCSDVLCAQSPYSFHLGLATQFTFPPAVVNAYAYGLYVAANDDIIVVGRADFSDPALCSGWVARVKPDLSLDTLFGLPDYHVRLVGFVEQCSEFRAVAVQPNGNIVAVGRTIRYTDPPDSGQFLVARLGGNGDNALDFNGGNPLIFGFRASPNEDVANAVALDSVGRIVVAGSAQYNSSADSDYAIARLTYAGQLDANFGSGGKVFVVWDAGGDNKDVATGVAIDYADKILVTGSYRTADFNFSRAVGTARLNVNGSVDTTFGAAGRSYARVAALSDDDTRAIVRDSSGRIVIAGTTDASTGTQGKNAFVMRLYGEGIFKDGLE
jgi:uncharacterized delta-60 repeat protein